MGQLQYFDGRLLNKQASTVYNNFINCVPVKPPYFNNSFRTLFTQGNGEKGDKEQFFVQKRKGFKKIKLYYNSLGHIEEETQEERLEGTCTDIAEMDGFRFFYIVNKDKTKCRIYKQININDLSNCINSCYNDIDKGYIINVTQYAVKNVEGGGLDILDYFPYSKCVYNKFVDTTFVKNFVRGGAGEFDKDNPMGTAITKRISGTKFSYLFNGDGTDVKANIGDYIYTCINTSEPLADKYNLKGYVHIVGKTNITLGGQFKGGVQLATTRAPGMDVTDDMNVINNVYYNVYSDFGHVLMFATADGLFAITDSMGNNIGIKYEIIGDMFTPSVYSKPKFQIQSFTTYNDALAVLGDNGALFISGQGYLKGYFSSSRITYTDGVFWNLKEYLGHLVLMGADRIGYYMFDFNKDIGTLFTLTDANGGFSKYSFTQVDDNFTFVRKSKDYYNMQIQFGYGAVKPMVVFGYMNNFLNTDLGMLNRTVDDITINMRNNQTYIFLNNGTGDTKILIYDRYYQTRFKRYVTGCGLVGVKDGIFFGRGGVYKYEGETDNGNEITQIITMVFGDQTHMAVKKLDYVKAIIGYNSKIDLNKTFFNVYIDSAGRQEKIVHSNLGRTMYVSNIMKASLNDGSVDSILFNAPTGVQVRESKGVKVGETISSLYKEFEEYKSYYDSGSEDVESYNTITLSKFGILKNNIGEFGEVFTLEMVAKSNTGIEFGGFFLGYEYPDVDITRIEDIVTETVLTPDSGMLPNNS